MADRPPAPQGVRRAPRPDVHLWLLGATIVIGGVLRLWNISAAQYLGDDGDFLQTAIDMVRQGRPLLAFPSSAGVSSGPLGLYLLAIPASLTSRYPLIVASVALLNTVCVPLVYFTTRDLFGRRAALLAAFLIAVNPWLVIYGRRTWITAFVAPAAAFFLWAAVRALTTMMVRAWAVAGAGAAATALVHLSGGLNVTALAAAAALSPRAVRWRAALAGGAVAAILAGPWAVGSLAPELSRLDPGHFTSAAFPDNSVERATLLVTGVGYQSITGQGARILNATAPPFTWIDTLARALAGCGWLFLLWVAWRQRGSQPGRSAACLAVALMVALPVLALWRPPQTGAFLTLYPYYFLSTLPGQVIGIAALLDRLGARFPPAAAALYAPLAGAQLLLAGPFFLTQEEYWPLGDYGVPFTYTEELSHELKSLAEPERAFVLVFGEEEDHSQQRLLAQVLAREYPRVRLFDGRDGLFWRTDAPSLLMVTTNDDEVATRLLLSAFPSQEIRVQTLPGSGWSRRVFRLTPSQLERWADTHLEPLAEEGGTVAYRRGGVGDFIGLGTPQIAVHWLFGADPPEPFLTKFRFAVGEREVHREEHVAYPAGAWQAGDWERTRFLNLFRLPADVRLPPDAVGTISHQGILSGQTSGSSARLRPRE